MELRKQSFLLSLWVLNCDDFLWIELLLIQQIMPVFRSFVKLLVSLIAEYIACLSNCYNMREIIEHFECHWTVILS